MKKLILTVLGYLLAWQLNAQQVFNVYTEEFPPYNYLDGGELKGRNVDIVNQLFARLNLKPNYVVLPWARSYLHALTVPNTLIFSIARNKERELLFKWVGALEGVESCLFSLKSRQIDYVSTLEEAKKYNVVTQLNGHFHVLLERAGFSIGKNMSLSVSVESAVQMLLTNRVDLIGLPRQVIYHTLSAMGKVPENLLEPQVCVESTALYLAFNKDTSDAIVTKFQQALKAINEE